VKPTYFGFYRRKKVFICRLVLSSKLPNYQHGVLLISAGAIEGLLKENRHGKFTKEVLFLHDNVPAHWTLATQKKLAYLGFHSLDHPPYSPDLAPSDYHLFLGLKKQLNGRHFSYNTEFIFIVWGSIPLCEYSIMECKNRLPQLLLYLVSK
jgi:transposase